MDAARSKRLERLIADSEEWLVCRALECAEARGYAEYTSPIREARGFSIASFSEHIRALLSAGGDNRGPHPCDNAPNDSASACGVHAAQRYHAHGVTLGFILGMLKCGRQAYLDLVEQSAVLDADKAWAQLFTMRFFDHVEMGCCTAWAAADERVRLQEHRAAGRHLAGDEERVLDANEGLDRVKTASPDTSERARAKDTLRLTHDEWGRTFDAVPDLVTILDNGYRIQRVNRAMAQRMGVSPEEAVGQRCFECVHGTMEPPQQCPHTLLMLDGREHSAEVYEPRLNGYFNVTASPIVDARGQIIGSIHIARDISERKRDEDALRKYERIFTATPDLISLLDRHYCYQAVNETYLKMSNKGYDAIVGHYAWELIGMEQFEQVSKPNLDRCLAGETTHHEAWYEFENTGRCFLSVTYSPFLDVDGRISGVVASGRDVTRLKQTEEALRRSEERFRLAVHCTKDLIYERDLTTGEAQFFGDIDSCLGYAPGGFPRTLEGWITHVHPDDIDRVMDTIRRQFASGEPYVLEYRLRKSDGTYADWLDRGLIFQDASGNLTKNIGAATNTTELKRAERALQDSEARYRGLYDSVKDGIVRMDLAGCIIETNRGYQEMLGYTAEELTRLTHRDLTPPAWHEMEAEIVGGQVLARGYSDPYEKEYIRRSGGPFPVVLRTWLIRDETGTPTGMWALVRDITESKRIEEDLRKAKETAEASNQQLQAAIERANLLAVQAETANRAKSQFLANMSHEIRTPLNGVIGMAGLLLDTPLNAEQREFAEIVRSSADALLALINDILDISKIEAGRLELESIEFDVRTMVDDTLDMLLAKAQENKLELACVFEHMVPSVLCGDPGRLRQILLNLVGNAIKFTLEGEVVVRVAIERDSATDTTLRFSVTDTGIGIPQNRVAQLFQVFSQVDASMARRFGGTGLGLAIAKRLAELMGGTIGVISEEGKGSTFWFTATLRNPTAARIPMPETTPRTDSPDRQPEAIDRARTHILLAEDNITNQKVALRILQRLGYRADAVVTGKEVLAAMESHAYDLILMDIQMPEMDGIEATIRIRERERSTGRHVRIVAMTAHALLQDREMCLAAGMDDYLAKPVQPNALSEAIARQLAPEKTSKGVAAGDEPLPPSSSKETS